MNRESNHNISGKKSCYTACSLLVIWRNSCSKLHYQKGSNLILFLITFERGVYVRGERRGERRRVASGANPYTLNPKPLTLNPKP